MAATEPKFQCCFPWIYLDRLARNLPLDNLHNIIIYSRTSSQSVAIIDILHHAQNYDNIKGQLGAPYL